MNTGWQKDKECEGCNDCMEEENERSKDTTLFNINVSGMGILGNITLLLIVFYGDPDIADGIIHFLQSFN
jgi:hypothetical protein